MCIQVRPSPARAPLACWDYPSAPFQRIHIDFLGPFNGVSYLGIIDAHTKWVEASKLYEFMSRFGLPQCIVSDNGSAFTSSRLSEFCELNAINHLTSRAFNPASNGQVESYVKVVKKGLKTCMLSADNIAAGRLKLLKYLFDYRNSVHSATGFSPSQLVFGQKLKTRLNLLKFPQPPTSLTSPALNVKRHQSAQSNAYGGTNRQKFVPGDDVIYKKFYNSHKFIWVKGKIVSKIGKVIYLISDKESTKTVKKQKSDNVT